MTARLARYLDRIGFAGEPRPDRATLDAIIPLHLAAIPFENLDTQLRNPPGIDSEAIYEKLVSGHRGGWCYENNGLLGAMLSEIGFSVTRLCAGVMRQVRGEEFVGSHLALMVHLDRDYLVDVGFGGSLTRALPLEEGEHTDGPFRISLTQVDDGYWRYEEVVGELAPFSFDFRAEPAEEDRLAGLCKWLGNDPQSPFVQNILLQRRVGDRHRALRGRVLFDSRPDGVEKRTLADADDLVATLKDDFALDVPEAASLWDNVLARHAELFGAEEAG